MDSEYKVDATGLDYYRSPGFGSSPRFLLFRSLRLSEWPSPRYNLSRHSVFDYTSHFKAGQMGCEFTGANRRDSVV